MQRSSGFELFHPSRLNSAGLCLRLQKFAHQAEVAGVRVSCLLSNHEDAKNYPRDRREDYIKNAHMRLRGEL